MTTALSFFLSSAACPLSHPALSFCALSLSLSHMHIHQMLKMQPHILMSQPSPPPLMPLHKVFPRIQHAQHYFSYNTMAHLEYRVPMPVEVSGADASHSMTTRVRPSPRSFQAVTSAMSPAGQTERTPRGVQVLLRGEQVCATTCKSTTAKSAPSSSAQATALPSSCPRLTISPTDTSVP